MVLQRWQPYSELRRVEEQINRLRSGFWGNGHSIDREPRAWAIPLDVVERDDGIEVRASLPTVDPKEVEVSIEDGVLTIRSQSQKETEEEGGKYLLRERRSGSFHRAVRLPDTVDASQATAYYEKGVLAVAIPKAESKKARQLTVEVRESPVAVEG
ncbi:MAG: HSP20 family protein [Chloroflexi bacterium]|jgi:HSP20 family protein|nr:MAG: HSP20 family protein [Chloroflexota bacterium]